MWLATVIFNANVSAYGLQVRDFNVSCSVVLTLVLALTWSQHLKVLVLVLTHSGLVHDFISS